MQPDGADLEYIYSGVSGAASASSPATPSRSPMYISAFSPLNEAGFIQEDTAPYAAVDDWAAPYPAGPAVFGRINSRSSNTHTARSPRPKTAGEVFTELPFFDIKILQTCKPAALCFDCEDFIPNKFTIFHKSVCRVKHCPYVLYWQFPSMLSSVLSSGARVGPEWDDSPAGAPARTRSQDGPGLRRANFDGAFYRPGSAEPYSNGQRLRNRSMSSRARAPHAWVGTYFDNELSPYVRESFEKAQETLVAQQATQSNSNWLRDQNGRGALRGGGGGGGWTSDRFQSPSGGRFASQAQAPVPSQQQRQGWDARAAYNLQADDMQSVYADQLNEMLRYANQCSVMLGSKYRYKAARRRPASAAAGKYRVVTALEGCVERHVIAVRSFTSMHHHLW